MWCCHIPFCVEVLLCRVQVVGMAGRGWMAEDLRCMKHPLDICAQSCLVFLDFIGCKYIYWFTSWGFECSQRIGSGFAWCMQASRRWDDNAELRCFDLQNARIAHPKPIAYSHPRLRLLANKRVLFYSCLTQFYQITFLAPYPLFSDNFFSFVYLRSA